jgi:hypothetical protein
MLLLDQPEATAGKKQAPRLTACRVRMKKINCQQAGLPPPKSATRFCSLAFFFLSISRSGLVKDFLFLIQIKVQ